MSGIGDERGKLLYPRAVAFAGTVMSFVLPIWWLVTIAKGDPNEVLTVCCAIFGASFIATKVEHLEDALAAAELRRSDEEIARLEEPTGRTGSSVTAGAP